ncbi:hypothetical protein INS49_000070 [Diaporthe citri]|uniref:uncharacterized protein n=1 Tax=Diaporthe citri TaxID=83186 RepID=UPI001C7F934C|nr:uncharacterized protein INS49_000070 [Diaporthe citri]KAG6365894.1 hypothetical protein INS49_000070 [Diaporthe citri]
MVATSTQPEAMDSAPSSICKVCQGIFQEGHRRRFRLRQIERNLWESKGSSYNQDITSDSSGENGQATTDPLNEESDDDVSKGSSDGEDLQWYSDEEYLGEGANEDTSEESPEEEEDQHRPSSSEDLDGGANEDTSQESSEEEEHQHRSSDEEDLDEEANEDASQGFSDEEEYRPSDFRGYDYFVYMHYPNLAMLQKSAEHGHCRSCHVLSHSLRSNNKNFDEFLEQAQGLEAQRLQKLQSNGDRAQFAVLDEDESDPNLDSAMQMQIEVCDNTGSDWLVMASLSPKKHGEARLFLTFQEKRLDHEFIQNAKLDVFCKPTESCGSGHLESETSFLASPVDDVDPALDHRPSKLVLSEPHIRMNKHVPYVCLSYCWGNTENPGTMTSNISQYLENITLDQLPKTIGDAILLCSKLEFRYIWIDSLCIIQDDKDDWMNQAAQMSRIYSKATLTIATPICLHSSESFVSKREEGNPLLALGIPGASLLVMDDSGKRYVLWLWAVDEIHYPSGFFIQIFSDWKEWEMGIRRDLRTWMGRAWTFQEWLLSPRVLHINHFTLWDCLGGYANELNTRSMAKVRRQRNPEVLGRDDFTWDLILAEYTSRGITNFSDRLPALDGLAKRYAETYHGHYLAGLWAEDLPIALLWMLAKDPTTNKRNIESPSWSWASVNEQVWFRGYRNAVLDTCVVSYFCRYNPPDSYSTVLDAWIHLEGPLCVVNCDDSVRDIESVAMLKLLTVPKNGLGGKYSTFSYVKLI